MKGGESLGNEEGSEETSKEDREEEVSPTRIYTPGVRPLIPGVFLCLKAGRWRRYTLLRKGPIVSARKSDVGQLNSEGGSRTKQA